MAWHGEIAEQNPAVYAVIDAAGVAHGKGMQSYLIMMAVRLLEMHRILKPSATLISALRRATADAYLRMLLDAIFSPSQFGNEIIWSYRRWPSKHPHFQRMHDVILRYWKGGRPTWNQAYEPPSESFIRRFKGRANVLDPGETTKRPADHDTTGLPLRDVWQLSILAPASKERVGYPTQKPLALLDCIIAASSNLGDTVLDPFCGCGTACVSAERLERQWVGIDISEKAAELVQVRIRKEIDLFHDFTPIRRSDIPTRTDLGQIPSYRTHKHQLFGKQEGHCVGCRVTFQFRNFHVEHIVPKSQGGSDHIDNLQLLCGACNSVKGDRSHAYLIATLPERGGSGPRGAKS